MTYVIIISYTCPDKRVKLIKNVKFVSEDEFNTFFNEIIIDLDLLMTKEQKYEIYGNDDFTTRVEKYYYPADNLIKLHVDFVI